MNPRSTTSDPQAGRSSRSRPKLDRDAVVDAALALGDAEGIDSITIRGLAQKLSVTPMALYWHFADKEAVLAATADRLWDEALGELDALPPANGRDAGAESDDPWAPLRGTLDALVQVMRSHPALAALMPGRVVTCEAGLVITERTLSFLADRGLDRSSAFQVARFVLDAAVMLVQNEPGAGIFDPQKKAEVIKAKYEALAALPVDRYPHVVASSDLIGGLGDTKEYIEESIALIVAGARYRHEALD